MCALMGGGRERGKRGCDGHEEGSREMMRLECERAVEKIKTGLNVSDGSGN